MIRRVAAVFAFLVVASGWLLAQDSPLPGPAGGFSGGTVTGATTFTSPVVFTGDNASGTGTVRIRPSDEDTQLVLCEAGGNSSPEMCTAVQHYNSGPTQSVFQITPNAYMNSSGVTTRVLTTAGFPRFYMSAGTSAAGNYASWALTGTGGSSAGDVILQASGLTTSNFITGGSGTVTNDFRGPILNSGSATCNGILAGYACINDDVALYSPNGLIATQATNSTAATGIVFYSSTSANTGAVFFANASVSDADIASKVVLRGIGFPVGAHRTDAVAAGTTVFEVMDNTSATGATLLTVDGDGNLFLNTAATRTKGTITLAAGTGTATVSSGCTPTCSDTTAVNAVQCSVSGTTLTANGTGTDVISYHCF